MMQSIRRSKSRIRNSSFRTQDSFMACVLCLKVCALLVLCSWLSSSSWASAPVGTKIVNTASLDYEDTGGFHYEDSSNSVVIALGGAPILTVVKTARPSPVGAGGELKYTIECANRGNVPARDVVLTDILPGEVTFLNATGGGKESQGVITWSIGVLGVDESRTMEVRVKTNDDLNTGDVIENVASITDSTGVIIESVSEVTIRVAPYLELEKSVGISEVHPDETIVYTIQYENTGSMSATQVRITDQLPAGTTFISATDGGIENERIVTWMVETLESGGSGSVQFTVRVNSNVPDGFVVSNIAHISSREGIDAFSNQVDVVVIPAKAILELEKSASSDTGYRGGDITYTIQYANTGNAVATQVRITDRVPAETTFISASDGGAEDHGTVIWVIESLAAGGTGSVQFTVGVNSDAPEDSVISNIASINSREGIDAVSNQVDVVVKIEPSIPAGIALVADPDVILGNGRDASKLTATVTDADGNPLPDGTIVKFTTTRGTFPNGAQEITVPLENGKAITYLVAEIISNVPVEAYARATAGTPETGVVEDEVKIIFSPGAIAGVVKSNMLGPIAGAQTAVIDEAGNVIGADVSDEYGNYLVFIPRTGDYTVVVRVRNEQGREVVLTEGVNIPELFGAVFEPDNAINGTVFDCRTRNILNGVALRLMDETGDPVLSGSGNGINVTTDSQGSYMVQGLKPGTYVLEVQQSIPGYYRHGTITVDALQKGELVIDVNICIEPLGYVYDSRTNQRIEGAMVNLIDANTRELISLPSYLGEAQSNPDATDASGNYEFFVKPGDYIITVTAPGYKDFRSDVITVGEDKDIININIPLEQTPTMTFTKNADIETAAIGDIITYTLTYQNTGGRSTNTVITDRVPDNTIFVSASDNGVETDGTVKWTLGTLEFRAVGSVWLTVRALSVDSDTVIENTATIDGDDIEPISDSVRVTVQIPSLSIRKAVSPSLVEAGENLTYTITIGNGGSGEATGVVIRDPVPGYASFVSATGGGSLRDGAVIWNVGTIAPGASQQVELVVKVDSPIPNETSIVNVATLTSDQTPEMQSTATARARSAPILSLEKEVDRTEALPGDIITYTLLYRNTGSDIATDVAIIDVLPGGLQYIEGGTYDELSGTVQWKIGILEPVAGNGTRSVNFRARVKEDFAPGFYEIRNAAVLTAAEVEQIQSNTVSTAILVPYIQLSKAGNKRFAEIGDIVTYMITVTNLSPNSDLMDVTVTDILPRGFGYLKGTGLVDGNLPLEPHTAKGRISFAVGQISRNGFATITYRASMGANAQLGDGVNTAQAFAHTPGTGTMAGYPLVSNQDQWQVQVRSGVFSSKGLIMGKVFIDSDGDDVQDKGENGVPNVALIMEDGTTVITDENGRYSIPEVDSGLHALRVDKRTLPRGYTVVGRDTRFAGKPHIQFIRVSSPAGADFMLKRLPPEPIEVLKPIVIQPSSPIRTPMPVLTLTQPTIVPLP